MSSSHEQLFGAMSSSSSSSSSESEDEGGGAAGSAKGSMSSNSISDGDEPPPEDDEDEDFDMYADLGVFQRSADPELKPKEELVNRIQELENAVEESLKERAELRNKVNELSRENKIILRNASSLITTAKAELTKKNAMLTNLQRSLATMTRKSGHSTSPAIREELNGILEQCRKYTADASETITAKEIQHLVETEKKRQAEKQKQFASGIWSKKIRLNNMTIYHKSDQIPFGRLETVTFPTLQKPKSSQTSGSTNSSASGKTSQDSSFRTPEQKPDQQTHLGTSSAGKVKSRRSSDLRNESPVVDTSPGPSGRVMNGKEKSAKGIQDIMKKSKDERERDIFGTPSPRPSRSPQSGPRHSDKSNSKSKSPARNHNTLHPDRARSPPRYTSSRYRARSRSRSPDRPGNDSHRRPHKYRKREGQEPGELTPSPNLDSRSRGGSDRYRSGNHQYKGFDRDRSRQRRYH